jgi:heme-degrading monooxygenase HmoA
LRYQVILEAAPLKIRDGKTAEFESAFREAQAILAASPGYISHELQRCVENRDEYLLLVRWQSLRAHESGFRGSEDYARWRALLHHFYEPFPTVSHYEVVDGAASV